MGYSLNSFGGVNSSLDTYIQGYHSSDNLLNFYFSGNAENGSYPLNSLTVINYKRIELPVPFEVVITAFPLKPGEFYEGSFSGSFKDSSALTVTHNIGCSFRLKKYY